MAIKCLWRHQWYSACANPVIYGFLNENFSKEFRLIWQWWKEQFKKVIRFLFPGLLKPDDPSTVLVQPVVIINEGQCVPDNETLSNAVELKQIKKCEKLIFKNNSKKQIRFKIHFAVNCDVICQCYILPTPITKSKLLFF